MSIVTDIICSIFFRGKRVTYSPSYIDVEVWKVIVLVGINVFTLVWHYKYIVSNVGVSGLLSNTISSYRTLVLENMLTENMPRLLNRFIGINQLSAFVLVYIFVNNIVSQGKFKRNLKLLIPVFIFCIDALLDGARGYIVNIFLGGIVYYYMIYQRSVGWKIKHSFKMITKIVGLFCCGAIGFVGLGGLMGRNTDNSIFERLAHYASGGIPLLDIYYNEYKTTSSVWGELTFPSLNKFIYRKFGIESFNYQRTLEFRSYKGMGLGNVYTAIRPYYQDFGIGGLIILLIIFSCFFSIFYRKIQYKNNVKNFDFSLLIPKVV